jgi:hypothetical protein
LRVEPGDYLIFQLIGRVGQPSAQRDGGQGLQLLGPAAGGPLAIPQIGIEGSGRQPQGGGDFFLGAVFHELNISIIENMGKPIFDNVNIFYFDFQ